MWSCAPSHGKWNKIIKFGLSVKLWEEIGFLQDPQKAYIFYAIRFLYFSQKKSRNKLCLKPHYTYMLFRTFSSHVNIKWFFLSSEPLNLIWFILVMWFYIFVTRVLVSIYALVGEIKCIYLFILLTSCLVSTKVFIQYMYWRFLRLLDTGHRNSQMVEHFMPCCS